MSILWTFRKFADPVEHLQEEGDRERWKLPEEEKLPDGAPPVAATAEAPATLTYRCRVCGHQGTRTYCPECLAETMEREKAEPGGQHGSS